MKRIIFTTHNLEGVSPEHDLRIVCEDQLLNEINIFNDFCDIKTATTDIETAREAGIEYFDGKNFHGTDNNNFYNSTPEWLKEKHKARVKNSVKVTQDIERIQIDDVEELDLVELAKRGGVYVIHVPTGKKKTQKVARPVFANAVEQGQKTTAITPLISICKTFHKNAEQDSGQSVAYYDELKEADLNKLGMVTTINSSAKPSIINHSKESDVLIVEEFCASVDVIAESKELKNSRKAIWETLKNTISSARTVFLLDADFNDNYINFIKSAGRTPTVIEMAPDYSDIDVELYEHGHIVANMVSDAQAGKRVLITTDSKRSAEEYARQLNGVEGVLMIHAENKGLPQQKAFLENPNDNLEGVNVLIYSPVMNRSISIEREHFEAHYGIFNGVLTPVSCVQQLRRDRTAKHFNVCVNTRNIIGYLDEVEEFETDEKILNELREGNRYLRQSIATSLPITFEALKFNVKKIGYNTEKGSQGSKISSAARRELKDEYLKGVQNAPEIEIQEAKARKGRDDLTKNQILERDAKLIRHMTGEVTAQSVEFYKDGKGNTRLKLLDFIGMSEEAAKELDQKEKSLAECDRSHAEFIRTQFRRIFNGMNTGEGFEFDEAFAMSALNYLKKLKTTNKVGIIRTEQRRTYTKEQAMRLISDFIKELGFTVRKRKNKYGQSVRRVENVEGVSRYYKHATGRDIFINNI